MECLSLRTRGIVLALLLVLVSLPLTRAQTPAQRKAAQQLFVQAQLLEKQGKLPQAIEKMDEVLRLVPQKDSYLAYSAALELRAGRATEALEHAREAARVAPKNVAYQVLFMKAALEARDAEQAEQSARKVISLGAAKVGKEHLLEARRGLHEALHQRALDLDREEKHDLAAKCMKEASSLDPKNTWYRTWAAELEKLATVDAFDRHALDASADMEKAIPELARYLIKPAKTDRDKARLLFRWVTNRITYDVEALRTLKLGDSSPEAVLKSRLCVCEGYARLYHALAKEAGLEVELVFGRCKTGTTGPDGKPLVGRNGKPLGHVWIGVKIDGEWKLLDPTWGAGSSDLANNRFIRHYNDYYFQTPPEQLILTHLPREPRWQLLKQPISEEEFDRGGQFSPALFRYGVTLEQVQALKKEGREVVECLTYQGPRIKIVSAPLEKQLQAGKRYTLQIESAGMVDIGASIQGKVVHFTRKGANFQGVVSAPAGTDIVVVGRYSFQDKRMYGILRYRAE
jgi:tetratricopeptide (TPR) repeat protein